MNRSTTTVLLLITFLLQSCTSSSLNHTPTSYNRSHSEHAERLYQQYEVWRGTPYQLGGTTRRGIDCSAFTQITLQQKLGIKLPRTTIQQQATGQPVDKRQLSAGDLVFFKTGGDKQRHVGIYIEDGLFLHASTSKGVIISRLDNPYWEKHYWKSMRVK